MKPTLLVSLLVLTGACTASSDQGAADSAAARPASRMPEATPTGAPESCVYLRSIRESRVQSDQVIDFHLNNGKVLRNTLPHSCPQLGYHRAFRFETSLSQLCNVDVITVIIPGGGPTLGATCGLGMFQPVELHKK